jgi:hypothetical protein
VRQKYGRQILYYAKTLIIPFSAGKEVAGMSRNLSTEGKNIF